MHEGRLPAALLEEPFSLPREAGQSPRGHDPNTSPDGGVVTGAPWNPDWRGEFFVGADYQGFGGRDADPTITQPTDWNSYTGLVVSEPTIEGYGGPLQYLGMDVELRAGSTIGWPTHGQTEPGFDPILLELTNQPGFDVGWQQWWQDSRRMLFVEPPDFSAQTQAIPAAGYP